jgi:hypothetical protein
MTTTATGTSTPKIRYTLQLLELAQQAKIPDCLPAGVKITLRGDLGRVVAAAELADSLETGAASWDMEYPDDPEVACADSPQSAAAGRALRDATNEWNAFTAAFTAAVMAVIR